MFVSRMFGRICRDTDEGGSGTGVGEEQLSFLEEMLGESTDTAQTNDETSPEIEASSQDQDSLAADGSIEPAEQVKASDKVDEKQDQGSETDQTIQSLRDQILALTEALSVDPLKQAVQPTVSGEEPKTAEQTKEILANFLSPDELDRLIDEPQLINTAFQRSQTAMLSSVGQLVAQEVNKQIVINRAVTDFYSSNSDLLPYAKFVQFVMQETEQKNKDKTYAEIFDTTANECRKRLGLSATSIGRDTNKGNQKPAFAGSKKGTARPSSEKQEWFDPSAAEMMNFS